MKKLILYFIAFILLIVTCSVCDAQEKVQPINRMHIECYIEFNGVQLTNDAIKVLITDDEDDYQIFTSNGFFTANFDYGHIYNITVSKLNCSKTIRINTKLDNPKTLWHEFIINIKCNETI